MTECVRLVRLRFWLLAMDAFAWLDLLTRDAYLYAVRKASDATDWGEGADCGEGEPF